MVPPTSFSAHGGSAKFKWIDTVTTFLNTETTFSFSEECSASRANTHTKRYKTAFFRVGMFSILIL